MSSFAAESADIQQMSNKLLCMIVTRLFIYRGCSSHYHGTLSSCDTANVLLYMIVYNKAVYLLGLK